jgi:hypothetical protein
MELIKNALEDQLHSQIHDICRQRQELDKNEREVIAIIVKEDLQNKTLIDRLLEESVRDIFFVQPLSRSRMEEDQEKPDEDEEDMKQKCRSRRQRRDSHQRWMS